METIVHISLNGTYTDGLSYQENYLPKYHKLMGYSVVLVAQVFARNERGEIYRIGEEDYIDNNGVRVVRINDDRGIGTSDKFRRYRGLGPLLEQLKPSIIFLHNFQFVDSRIVARYCDQHQGTILYVDNHADDSNISQRLFWISKNILHRRVWRKCAALLIPHAAMFWGVLPSRVDYLTDVYGVPKEKCGLLVMGADDQLIEQVNRPDSIALAKRKLGICNANRVLVAGGKFDRTKCQIIELMKAFNRLNLPDVTLLVFGPVDKELKDDFFKEAGENSIVYVSWASEQDSYEYFAMSDLAVFPGRHSVYWEVAAGIGVPLLVKRWSGADHVDCGGNLKYTSGDNAENYYEDLLSTIGDAEVLSLMKESAIKNSCKFRYKAIAERSIGVTGHE